jgi:hypothetical protein
MSEDEGSSSSSSDDEGVEEARLTEIQQQSGSSEDGDTSKGGKKKKKNKRGSNKSSPSKKTTRLVCPKGDKAGKYSSNVTIFGGRLTMTLAGVSVPQSSANKLLKYMERWNNSTGVAGKGDPLSKRIMMAMPVLPTFLWCIVVLAYAGVVNLMDAYDPTIIDARHRYKWTYTISQSIAIFVLGVLWWITDRKYSVQGYTIMFFIFMAWLCELINAQKNNVDGTTYTDYNNMAHNINSMAGGVAFEALIEMAARKTMKRRSSSND